MIAHQTGSPVVDLIVGLVVALLALTGGWLAARDIVRAVRARIQFVETQYQHQDQHQDQDRHPTPLLAGGPLFLGHQSGPGLTPDLLWLPLLMLAAYGAYRIAHRLYRSAENRRLI